VDEPYVIQSGTPVIPTDLEGLRRFIALKMSKSEMGGNCQKWVDNRPECWPTELKVL
jgi:hypothetical protein